MNRGATLITLLALLFARLQNHLFLNSSEAQFQSTLMLVSTNHKLSLNQRVIVLISVIARDM